jgi:CrcB protein
VSAGLFLAVAVAGGFGSVCRFVLDGLIRSRTGDDLPWGTVTLNLTGSFALGLITGLAVDHVVSDAARMVIGTGFLGGYTTFSTASFETVRLLQQRATPGAAGDRRWAVGLLNAFGVLVVATGAAGLGLWAGGLT